MIFGSRSRGAFNRSILLFRATCSDFQTCPSIGIGARCHVDRRLRLSDHVLYAILTSDRDRDRTLDMQDTSRYCLLAHPHRAHYWSVLSIGLWWWYSDGMPYQRHSSIFGDQQDDWEPTEGAMPPSCKPTSLSPSLLPLSEELKTEISLTHSLILSPSLKSEH